jgi:hypothetical protein
VQKRGLTIDQDRSFMTIYLNDPALTREMHRRTELCVPVLPDPHAAVEQRRPGHRHVANFESWPAEPYAEPGDGSPAT